MNIILKYQELKQKIEKEITDKNLISECNYFEQILKDVLYKLENHDKLYQEFVSHSPDILYKFSNKKGGIFWSDRVKNILGYEIDELKSNPFLWFNSIHPDDKTFVQKAIDDYNKGNEYNIEYRIKTKSGDWIWLHDFFIHKTIIDDEIIIEGHASNITKQKELEIKLKESEERWKFALDGAEEGVWDWNMETNDVFFSQKWKEQLGYSENEIKNNLSEWEIRVHPEDLQKCFAEIQLHMENKIPYYSNTHRILCKNGQYKWILDRGKIMQRDDNGKPIRMIGTHSDLTERVLMEKKLIELNSDKDRFIQILSHDLRSPFNSLLGFSDLLLKNLHKYDMQKIENQIRIIHQTIHQTYDLLEQILLWAKSQSGKLTLELQKLEFLKEITEIIKTLENQANEKYIKLNYFETEKIILTADLNMFKTVMRNLISNAIKFTHKNGQINISAERNHNHAIITVSDNGIGIDKNVIPKLWEFGDNYSTEGTNNEKGTGFGLTLCKELIEKHGEQIWVESEVGKGSDFKFTLPLCND